MASNKQIANVRRGSGSGRRALAAKWATPELTRAPLGWAMLVGLGLTGCPTAATLDTPYEEYEPVPTGVTTNTNTNTVTSTTTSGGDPCNDSDVNDRAMSYWCGTPACHGTPESSEAAAPLWLFSPTRTTDMLDLPAVTEGCTAELIVNTTNPENSLIITSMKHTSACGLEMPDGIDIDPTELTCIEQWVMGLVD